MANRLEIPFTKGIQAAGNRNASSEPGKLDLAYNVHVRPEQADVLYRRPGVTTVGTRSPGTRVGVIEGKLLQLNTDSVLLQQTNGSMRTILGFGLVSEISARPYDTERGRTILCAGYAEDSSGNAVAVTAYDTGSGQVRVRAQRIWRGVGQLLADSGYNAFAANTGSGNIWVFEDSSTEWVMFHGGDGPTPSLAKTNILKAGGGTYSPVSLIANAYIWDVVPYSSGWVVLYQDTATNRLNVALVSTSFVVSGTTAVTAAGPVSPTVAGLVWVGGTTVHVWHGGYTADSDTLYCHYVTVGGASVNQLTLASALGASQTLVSLTVGGGANVRTSGGSTEAASYCFVVGGAGPSLSLAKIFRANASGVSGSQPYVGAIHPRSRLWTSPDWYGARLFGVKGPTYGLWRIEPTTAFNTTEPLVYQSNELALTSPPVLDFRPKTCSTWVSSDSSQAKCLMWSSNADHFRLSHVGLGDELGQVTESNGFPVVLCGAPRYWDGSRLLPIGIPQAPSITVSAAAGGSFAAGNYIYSAVWEFTDARGKRTYSPAATLQTVVVAAGEKVVVTIDRGSRVADDRGWGLTSNFALLRVYRTEAGGTQPRAESEASARTHTNPNPYGFVGIGVTYDDLGTTSYDGEVLYTSLAGASELVSSGMESVHSARVYSDRMLTVGRLFPESVRYTKTVRQGRCLEPNQNLVLNLPQEVTGLAYQDGNVYAFSADNCWAFAPQFADDTGNGTPSVDPVPLSTGIGCTQPRSIVETPGGVFFIGPRGYYMIARGGAPPQFVGADVEPYFIDYPTCQGVAHNPRTHEVAWVMSNGSDHRVIVLNYQAAQWFAWRIGDTGTAQATELTTLGGGVTCLSTGFVFGERGTANAAAYVCSDTQLTDVGSLATAQIPVEIRSRDIQPDGIGSICRVRSIVADVEGGASSVLRISESHDGGTTWSAEYSLATDDGNQPPVYQFAVQRTRGVRFRLRTITGDVPPLSLSGVSLSYSSGQRVHTSSSRRRG